MSKVEGVFKLGNKHINYMFNVDSNIYVINANLNFNGPFTPEEGLCGLAMLAQTIAYNCGFQIDMKELQVKEPTLPDDPNPDQH